MMIYKLEWRDFASAHWSSSKGEFRSRAEAKKIAMDDISSALDRGEASRCYRIVEMTKAENFWDKSGVDLPNHFA